MTIGIVGGLGPMAGADLYRRLVRRSAATSDQAHEAVVLISDPAIPSREDHILGTGPSPVPALLQVVTRLEMCGADVIGIASFTTHAYYDDIAAATTVPVIDLVAATVDALTASEIDRVAVLGARVSRRLGLLERRISGHPEVVMPPEPEQVAIDELITGVKRHGDEPRLRRLLTAALDAKWIGEADAVLLSCTDLAPLLPEPRDGVLCVSDILAEALLRKASTPRRRP